MFFFFRLSEQQGLKTLEGRWATVESRLEGMEADIRATSASPMLEGSDLTASASLTVTCVILIR